MKNKSCLKFLVLISIAIISHGSHGQQRSEIGLPSITNYTPSDFGGAPISWSMIQDDRGIMYLGNTVGIIEFDGSSWQTILETDFSTGIRTFEKDDHGKIYVGGAQLFGYLACDSLGRTEYVSLLDSLPEEIQNFQEIWGIQILKGEVVLNTHDHIAILKKDGSSKIWESEAGFHMSAIINNELYIREWGVGLQKLEGDDLVLLTGGEMFANERIYNMLPYEKDQGVLITTVNTGLWIYNDEKFRPFKTEADEIFSNYQVYLPGIVLPNGTYAINTIGGGCVIIDGEGRLIQQIDRKSGLQDGAVLSTYLDRDEALWLCLSNGISRVEINSPFTLFEDKMGLESTVFTPYRFKGKLYAGTTTGLSVFDKDKNEFTQIEGVGIQCFDVKEINGDLLTASYTGIAKVVDGKAIPIRASVNRDYVAFQLLQSSINKQRVYVSIGDKLGSLLKEASGNWIDEGYIDGLSDFSMTFALEDKAGNLWIGTQNKGLVKLTFDNPKAGPSNQIPEIKIYDGESGLSKSNVTLWQIHDDLVAVSGDGFYKYNAGNDRFEEDNRFDEIKYVLETTNPFMIVDEKQRIWIGGHGLIQAIPDGKGEFNFMIEPFLSLAELDINWVFPENDIAWIGSAYGLYRYDEKIQPDYDKEYNALIRKVETGSDVFLSAGLIPEGESVNISYDDNTIRFQFAAATFEKSNKTLFQTYLQGFDKKYSSWSLKTEKEYTNLHEGTYVFKVKARNIYQNVSMESTFTFTIKPPWYRAWWAITFYVLFGGFSIWLIVRIRTNQLKAQHEVLEKTVVERTSELSQRIEELAVINSVQQGLVAEMDLNGIYKLVGEKIQEIFDAQIVSIATFNFMEETEIFQYLYEDGELHYPDPRKIDILRQHLIDSKTQFIANTPDDPALRAIGISSDSKPVPGTKMPQTAVFMPMIVGEQVNGYISLQNIDRTYAFSESDISLLATLANSMSVALENARLFSATQQNAAEMATVTKVSSALASQLDLDTVIEMVGTQMKDLFQADIVFVAIHDKNTDIINFPYVFGDEIDPIKYGEGLTSSIIKTGEPALINQDVNARYQELGIARTGREAASFLGVPIFTGKKTIGVISVQSTKQVNRFNEDDMRLLSTIASNVGVAIHNARLFDQTLKAQAEAEEAKIIAEGANEAKSAFLSTVSHELRTPLTSVIGFAKIIRKRLNDRIFPNINGDEKTTKTMTQISQNLDVVVSEGERLTKLINEVLDLAKIEAGKMEWHMDDVNIKEIIERAIAATASVFESKKIKQVNNIPKELPTIKGDRDKLIQVIINLLSNAAKFTDKGSVKCSASIKDGDVIINIRDTGMGISEADQHMVFDKFKQVGDTLTDKPKGTGLGLPICKEIIEYHGGRIWVESELNKGSVFSFSLPLSDEKNVTLNLDDLVKQLKKQVLTTTPNISEKPQTILVADDEAHIRDLLRQELTESGFTVREAKNGKEALEEIRRELPDLVILDVMMPEMNGFDVAAILKNDPATMDLPILILSIVQDKERGFRLGVDRYLTKPIDTDQLFKEVGNLLEQGKSKRKVMIVDENSSAVKTLAEVLENRGYAVVESNGIELVQKAIDSKPDIIILNSVLSKDQELVKTLRFEKGLENVLFMMYQ